MGVSASDVAVGDTREMVLFDDLSRTQIVMYAGASGDYNPIHSDERFAKEIAGYPSVFAHGMLTMGATGRIVTDWFGVDRVVRYSARFVNQVWPGDSLTSTASVDAVREQDGETLADLSIVTVNGDDTAVLTGTGTVRLDR
jgi:acyl dehydratase